MPFWKTTLKNKDLIPEQICSHSVEVQRSSTRIWKLRHAWYSNSSSSTYQQCLWAHEVSISSSVKWDNSMYNIKLLRGSNENKAFKRLADKTFNGLSFFLFCLFLLGRENKTRATFRTINLITVCMINGKTQRLLLFPDDGS